MPIVNIEVRGKPYPLACDVGQEEHILALGRRVDERLQKLSKSLGKGSDIRLLVMTAVMMEHEMQQMKKKNDDAANLNKKYAINDKGIAATEVKNTLDAVSSRLEKIASFLGTS